ILRSVPQDQNSYSKSFRDVRTITKRIRLDPELEAICFPKCFSLYEPEDALVTCIYCKSKKAQACGESLFKSKHDPLIPQYQPMSHASIPLPTAFVPFIPRLVYHTQKFNSWLKWSLNVPGLEDEILSWRQTVQSAPKNKITDIQQSKALRSFSIKAKQALSGNELRLTFSLYIDWFNPFSNKLSGRNASMGVVALTCLDLSPHGRNKHNNLFIAGIIPGPKELDMTTISHVLAPLIDDLVLLNPGIFVNSEVGEKLECRPSDDTLVKQKRLLRLNGIHWSELNRLPYWDPVRNVALGVMHN
ncbi:hypothetical protein VP01_2958g5, partial [Puccinia sorghi]